MSRHKRLSVDRLPDKDQAAMRQLISACEALDEARNISAAHAAATAAIESAVMHIEAEIAEQERYVSEKHIPAATDFVMQSLIARHANLIASRETLRVHGIEIERALRTALEQFSGLEAAAESPAPDTGQEDSGTPHG